MPWSSGFALRLARSVNGCLPALVAALLLATTLPANAITGIRTGPLSAEVGRMFVSTFIPVNSHLPKYPVDWSLSPPNCLTGSGISLDGTNGTLAGTPSEPGSFSCIILAVDTFPDPVTTAQTPFTLVVEPNCVAPSIGSGTPPAATTGVPYEFTVSALGNPAPTLTIAGLPAGLAFDAASSAISGTPVAAGTSILTIAASSDCGSVVQTQTLVVNRAPTTLTLVALPPIAVFGQPVTATLAASGGGTPPQGTLQLCVRGGGMFCGPPFDTIPPGTPPEKITAPRSSMLDPGGHADFRLTGLTIDAFTLSAFYAGDPSHLPATAGPVDELVIKGVLLPEPAAGRGSAAASSAPANAIPALSPVGMALLWLAVAALAAAALRRRAQR
ncbi:MAG TPA: Ig domain-containing protein [Casimicrobiaceae bacterium]|jgi:hypothetical protein